MELDIEIVAEGVVRFELLACVLGIVRHHSRSIIVQFETFGNLKQY